LRAEILLGALGATAVWAVAAIFVSGPLDVKDIAGPIATVFAAAMAGWIAYTIGRRQVEVAEKNWKTSNEKIVLELFDKRLAIFEDNIRAVISEVMRSAEATDEVLFRYDKAIDRVPYFFGEEVQNYLNQLRHHLIELGLAVTMMAANDPDRHEWIEKNCILS
jgi:hypothetical protein